MEYQIFQIPMQQMCEAVVGAKITGEDSPIDKYNIQVRNSPVGKFQGWITAIPLFSPGSDGEYKDGDRVKVLGNFVFNTDRNIFVDADLNSEFFIVGKFSPNRIMNFNIENPANPITENATRFINDSTQSGISIYDNGSIVMSTTGSTMSSMRVGGYGVNENGSVDRAQNFSRVLTNNGSNYLAKDHFGLYSGSDMADKAARVTPQDSYIIKRSFITQTKSPDNWVSTCEGAFQPYFGANNNLEELELNKEVLSTKIINYGNKRITIEMGEPGDTFLNIRVDDVVLNERYMPIVPGATPAVLGNLFKFTVSDSGDVEMSAGNSGIPGANIDGVKVNISGGDVSVQASGSVTLTHGDVDEALHSIKMDPNDGIDITSANGVRINGQEAVLASFIDWFKNNFPAMFICAAPGAPAVPNPAALTTLTALSSAPGLAGGMSSKELGIPAIGVIADVDTFTSI